MKRPKPSRQAQAVAALIIALEDLEIGRRAKNSPGVKRNMAITHAMDHFLGNVPNRVKQDGYHALKNLLGVMSMAERNGKVKS